MGATRICFVVGFPRSGTTMLAAILARHSAIAATPETMFYERLHRPIQRAIDNNLSPEKIADICFKDKRFRDLGLDSTFGSLQTGKCLRAGDVLRAALVAYGRKANKSLVVEKSPIHLLHWEKISQDFPAAKFIAIVRDGRDSVASLLDVPWSHKSVPRHSAEWVWRMAALAEMRQTLGRRMHVCRYEDLVRSPMVEVSRLCEFLGVGYESTLLSADGKTSAVVPKWESAWKAKAAQGIDGNSLGRWKQRLSPREAALATYIMKEQLENLGYPTNNSSLPPLLVRLNAELLYRPAMYGLHRSMRTVASKTIRKNNV